jgi:hypothetical protein
MGSPLDSRFGLNLAKTRPEGEARRIRLRKVMSGLAITKEILH